MSREPTQIHTSSCKVTKRKRSTGLHVTGNVLILAVNPFKIPVENA